MKRHSILQISDIHLSAQRAYNYANWEAALRYANAGRVELAVISGDVCLDDPDCEEDHDFARLQLARLEPTWRVIPGNHDVGDSGPRPYMGQNVDIPRLRRYERRFGSGYWSHRLGDWVIIGINSMICGSGLDAETEQLAWLRHTVAADRHRPIVIFSHKPLFIDRPEEEVVSHWCITPDGRHSLLAALEDANVRLVASGHTHHYRTMNRGCISYVWAPAVGHIDFDDPIPFNALTQSGIVRYELDDNGIEFTLVVPEGLETWNAASTIKASGSLRAAPFLSPEASMAQRLSGRQQLDDRPILRKS